MFVIKYTMGFLAKGKEIEKQFAKQFATTSFSNDNEDIHEHWDFKLESKFDVKDVKKINRNDISTNEFYHIVEIKNVNGELGWLYGDANFFIFSTNEYGIIVAQEALKNFIKEKVTKVKVNNVDEALYCLYTREGRKDVMTLVKTIDLMMIACEVIKRVDGTSIKHDVGNSIYPEKNLNKKMVEIFKNKKETYESSIDR